MAAALDKNTRVGVLGAGAMGTGIAHVAAVAGHHVVIVDSADAAVQKSRATIAANLARDVEKKRISADDSAAAQARLSFVAGDAAAFAQCGLVIEAIVEDLVVKRSVFASIEATVSVECVLATNTSSLSVADIAKGTKTPNRVIGLHFFNPANVLPLVEVIATAASAAVAANARALVDTWGKTTVSASDTPGFIVNRVARPFYGESLCQLEEGIADVATIDWAMKEVGGFKMGPFELMDLIGNDVNYAVTKSVYEALGNDPRYRPSKVQRLIVEAGKLGRKTGAGYYQYGEGAQAPAPTQDRALGQRILDRTLAMLINEAADAVDTKIATRDDVDLAMTKGVNYPKGLLAWADDIGVGVVTDRMLGLQTQFGGVRYRPSPLLVEMARAGKRFYP